MNIDRTRRAAKRMAWQADSHNPFRKLNSRQQYGTDEEEGIGGGQARDAPQGLENGPSASGGNPGIGQETEEERQTSQDSAVAGEKDHPSGSTHARKRRAIIDKFSHNHKEGPVAEQGISHTNSRMSQRGKKKFTFMGQLRATIFNSWINILLIAVPVGIAVRSKRHAL